MATVAQAFHKFVGDLELTQAEQDEASRQQRVLRDNLRDHLGGIERDILSGSYSRRTAIRPLNDIDVFIILEEAKHGAIRGQHPTACLEAVKAALGRAYPTKAAAKLQGRSVNIDFSGTGIAYDIVPAFNVSEGVYIIPDRERKNWIKTNPEKHRQALQLANEKAGNMLNPLIKAAKHWNANNKKPLRSFHLEVMSYGAFKSPPSSFAQGLRDLLSFLAGSVLLSCPEPAGIGPSIDAGMPPEERRTIQTALMQAAEVASRAILFDSASRVEEAHGLWRGLLGPVYPERGR
jgi:hypothetical protein